MQWHSCSYLVETIPANHSSTDGAKIQDFSALESNLEEILRVLFCHPLTLRILAAFLENDWQAVNQTKQRSLKFHATCMQQLAPG
jgi:hypothetical protein